MWIKVKNDTGERKVINSFMIQSVFVKEKDLRAEMQDGSEIILGSYPDFDAAEQAFDNLMKTYPFRNVINRLNEDNKDMITSDDNGINEGEEDDPSYWGEEYEEEAVYMTKPEDFVSEDEPVEGN